MEPIPTQLTGAAFLAARKTALLADSPRVGKTGASLLAAKQIDAHRILIITTTSGRAVWRRAVKDWLGEPSVIIGSDTYTGPITITSWDAIRGVRAGTHIEDTRIKHGEFDVAILDECHRAKNPESKTSRVVYGRFDEHGRRVADGIVTSIPRVWHLTGTPMPHDPGDLWTMLRSSAPDLLRAYHAAPDVTSFDAFQSRYCIVRMKRISKFNSIPVVVGGRNLPELKERMGDWMLRRTQADIGMIPPVRELMPLLVPASLRRQIDALDMIGNDIGEVLAAIDNDQTKSLEMQLGPLRRLTGKIKAEAVVAAVKEEFEDSGEKLVLAFYHREVGEILQNGLHEFCLVKVDGSTAPRVREDAQELFKTSPECRVFLAQIDAASEAIDLSAANQLWFVETTFSPKSMQQMAARILNVDKKQNTYVKVCYIENSIDESIQAALLRLFFAIKEVIG